MTTRAAPHRVGKAPSYFQMLMRAQQCQAVARLAASPMSVDAIASMLGVLRADVVAMLNEHRGREQGGTAT